MDFVVIFLNTRSLVSLSLRVVCLFVCFFVFVKHATVT